MNGVDLGASTEHDGRTFFFFGDVALPDNPDLLCFTRATSVQVHGGHLALGWEFFLPNDHQGAGETTGQGGWRFCPKCHGLFWERHAANAACPAGGAHDPVGWEFFLPNDHQGAGETTGQGGWRFCPKCHGLFWSRTRQTRPVPRVVHTTPSGGSSSSRMIIREPPRPPVRAAGGSARNAMDSSGNTAAWKGVCAGTRQRLRARGGARRQRPIRRLRGRTAHRASGPERDADRSILVERACVRVRLGRPAWVGCNCSRLVPRQQSGSAHSGTYRIERRLSTLVDVVAGFWQVAPVVVDAQRHPELAGNGPGVVLIGHGHNASAGTDCIHLAWMPLAGHSPSTSPIRYFTGTAWSADPREATALIRLGRRYTSVSLAWMEDAGLWVLLYGTAHEATAPGGPIVARFSRSLIEWGEQVVIFDPGREGAWGAYMHRPGADTIHPDVLRPRPGTPRTCRVGLRGVPDRPLHRMGSHPRGGRTEIPDVDLVPVSGSVHADRGAHRRLMYVAVHGGHNVEARAGRSTTLAAPRLVIARPGSPICEGSLLRGLP